MTFHIDNIVEAHYNLSLPNGELGMHQEQALQIQPDNEQAHNDLGLAYGKSGKHREAIKAFKEAILMKPDYAEAHYNLAITYLILKDKDAALREYTVLKNIDQERAIWLFDLIQI
jgi:tetratricopeptide (TPR) repeat protein